MSGSVADTWTGALQGGQSEYNDPPDTHAGIFGRNARKNVLLNRRNYVIMALYDTNTVSS